jgi:hypothetical protein
MAGILSKFEGGATRSVQSIRYDLVSVAGVRAMARRLTLGADRHGANNWKRGGEAFRQATVSHLMTHLLDYMEHGNAKDANTDAIICNAAFLCDMEERKPYVPEKVESGLV